MFGALFATLGLWVLSIATLMGLLMLGDASAARVSVPARCAAVVVVLARPWAGLDWAWLLMVGDCVAAPSSLFLSHLSKDASIWAVAKSTCHHTHRPQNTHPHTHTHAYSHHKELLGQCEYGNQIKAYLCDTIPPHCLCAAQSCNPQ